MIGFVLAILALAIVTVSLVFLYCNLGKFWPSQARTKVIPEPPTSWPYGDVAWRGCIRAAVGGLGGWTFLVASSWCFMLLTSFGRFEFVSNQAARDWLGWGLTVGLVGMLLAALLSVVVFLFNRPKRAVPPAYRHLPGAIEEWRHQTSETAGES
jgi:hypothetical protein